MRNNEKRDGVREKDHERWEMRGGRCIRNREHKKGRRDHSDNETTTGRKINKYSKYKKYIHNNNDTINSNKQAYNERESDKTIGKKSKNEKSFVARYTRPK